MRHIKGRVLKNTIFGYFCDPVNILCPEKAVGVYTFAAYIQMHFKLHFIMGSNIMNPDQTVLAPEKFIGWARKSMEIKQASGYKTSSCSTLLSMKVILLINVIIPTIVGILIFSSMINTSERLKANTSSFVGILVFMSS